MALLYPRSGPSGTRRRTLGPVTLEPAPRSWRSVIVLAASVACVAGVVYAVARSGRGEPPPRQEPATATIEIVSPPPGASVERADGGVLGLTPFSAVLPKADGELVVLVKHEGYRERRVTVPLYSTAGRIDVT